MLRLLLLTLLCTCGLAHIDLWANNVEISNVRSGGQELITGDITIVFDLSWDNSWRITDGPANFDAVWIFGKYRVNGSDWRHMPPAALDPGIGYWTENSPEGAMIYRSSPGVGDISFSDLRFVFNYRAEGIDDNAEIDVRLFAVEMVFVPEGPFTLGLNSDGTQGSFFRVPADGNLTPPYGYFPITSETAKAISSNPFGLYYIGSGDQTGTLDANYPKGYAGFYCMKYEVSQQQWVDFFNTLTPTQQFNLDATGVDGKNSDGIVDRNAVSWANGSLATTTAPNVPMNFITNDWFYAYLDWAGLRPMTEFEFEKACRGPLGVQANEYVWGTNRIADVTYTVLFPNASGERVNNAVANQGNATYGVNLNILRCGIFAASAPSADREETGGTYYGIMDMGGNLYERTIGVGSPVVRAFEGTHGDGTLTSAGGANVASWPVGEDGFSFRGGAAGFPSIYLRIGDRTFGNFTNAINLTYNGIRGVRTR
ncbi:MAG: SUMF1/EgtB/PvdO family nonheme iron enzyme [Bacteroidota bacterium]